MSNEKKMDKDTFKYDARRAAAVARTNQLADSYTDDLGTYSYLLDGAKVYDKKLATKIETVNAAHRDLDSYLVEQFKEADGDGTANG